QNSQNLAGPGPAPDSAKIAKGLAQLDERAKTGLAPDSANCANTADGFSPHPHHRAEPARAFDSANCANTANGLSHPRDRAEPDAAGHSANCANTANGSLPHPSPAIDDGKAIE